MTHNTNALQLAASFTPDIDTILENGIATFGIKGSGKSNLVALLIEQFARYRFPQVIFDTENEYASVLPLLPRGVLASAQAIPTAHDILNSGLQVIVNLQSWSSPQDAALAMQDLIDSLFTIAKAQAPAERVPCALHIDEAGYWLPQRPVSYLSKETRTLLLNAFALLGSRGRKYGLTPFLYTQFISQIDKDVIRQCGIRVLMRQTQDNDITRYGEYIKLTEDLRAQISSFAPGQALLHGLPDGSRPLVRFNQRASEHVSHTPTASRALAKFAGSIDTSQFVMAVPETRKKAAPSVMPECKDFYSLPEASVLVGRSRAVLYQHMRLCGVKPTYGRSQTSRITLIAHEDIARLQASIAG